MAKIKNKLKIEDLPKGAVIDRPGSTSEYKTGTWRVQMPLLDRKKCQNCLICANFCPENCIKLRDANIRMSRRKVGIPTEASGHTNPVPEQVRYGAGDTNKNQFVISHIDYFYCKGCGICAQECPNKAIVMREV